MGMKKEGVSFEASIVAGGVAGAVSRTVVSPFERVKILLQIQSNNSTTAKLQDKNMFRLIQNLYKNEGIKGMFRGNGMNCIRVCPYLSIQYLTFESYKNYILNTGTNDGIDTKCTGGQLSNTHRLIGGCLSGGTSVLFTYPMDLVKTRLSIQTAVNGNSLLKSSKPPGMLQLLTDTYKSEGGIRGLYRGLFPTALGVVPYVALNFQIYEAFKYMYITNWGSNDPSNFTDINKLCFGALSGGLGQIVIYPFDLLRRRFQILTMKSAADAGFNYTGVIDALIKIGKHEGFKGYYRGLTANLFKVVPSTAVQWWTYEYVVGLLKKKTTPF